MNKGHPTLTLITHRLWHIFFYDVVDIIDYTTPRQSTGK